MTPILTLIQFFFTGTLLGGRINFLVLFNNVIN